MTQCRRLVGPIALAPNAYRAPDVPPLPQPYPSPPKPITTSAVFAMGALTRGGLGAYPQDVEASVVGNVLSGVYWLKDPPSKTRTTTLTLAGCVLAMAGGVVLGNLK